MLQSQPGVTVAQETDGCQSSEGDIHGEGDGDPDHPPQRQEEGPRHGHCRGKLASRTWSTLPQTPPPP